MLIVPRNGEEVGRLGLSQCFDIAGNRGGLMPFGMSGWIQGTKRRLPDCPRCGEMVDWDQKNQSHICRHCGLTDGIGRGPITQQLAQKNIITAEMMEWLWHSHTCDLDNANSSDVRIYITNDDLPDHEYKTLSISTYEDTGNLIPVFARNNTEKYYTYTGTYGVPTSDRTVRKIGICTNIESTMLDVRQAVILSITTLSSEIVQTTSETFEVIYKYQFVRV